MAGPFVCGSSWADGAVSARPRGANCRACVVVPCAARSGAGLEAAPHPTNARGGWWVSWCVVVSRCLDEAAAQAWAHAWEGRMAALISAARPAGSSTVR